jgi:hypothetical protein
LRVEVSSNYLFIAPIGADCREGAVQSLATRVIPFPHRNPDARAEPAFVVKLGSHKLAVGAQRSLQEAGARRRNLHKDRIIATECEVDEELCKIRVTSDYGGCTIFFADIAVMDRVPFDAELLACESLWRRVEAGVAASDKAVGRVPLGVREVDEPLALLRDRHVRDDRIDRSILQSRYRLREGDGYQRASSADLGAESSGDLRVGATENAVLIDIGIGRITRIHSDPELPQTRLLARAAHHGTEQQDTERDRTSKARHRPSSRQLELMRPSVAAASSSAVEGGVR